MEYIEVNPWIKTDFDAFDVYRTSGLLYVIPYVTSNDLTLGKSKEKYLIECRVIPQQYSKIMTDKVSTLQTLNPSVELNNAQTVYLKGSSSQHMTTILDGVENSTYDLKGVDIVVASDTLHKIAGAVFKQDLSFKLRAHLEVIDHKKLIILCDDDLDEIDLNEPRRFTTERKASLSFAQRFCEQDKARNTNPYLRGCKVIFADLKHGKSVVRMAVVGEVDMLTNEKTVNACVLTGRTQRVHLGYDDDTVHHNFEYIWSRCFWIGAKCLIGMRPEYDEPVETIHRFDLKDYCRNNKKRLKGLPDVATTCVAQVMNRLRDAVDSMPNVNWIIEYNGRPEGVEPFNIKISIAPESYSFWLIREKYKMLKDDITTRKAEEAKRLEEAREAEKLLKKAGGAKILARKPRIVNPPKTRICLFKQPERRGLSKIRTDTTVISEQFDRLAKYLSKF